MIKRTLKRMVIGLVSIVVLLFVIGFLFINLSSQFGGKATSEQKLKYATYKNYKEGKFVNEKRINMDMGFGDMVNVIRKMFNPNSGTRPQKNIVVHKLDSTNVADYNSRTRLIWFGHSAFLLQMNHKNILIDPMFGNVPAPHPWLGAKRFSKNLPIEIGKLPQIDAVIISHDHYDHLDYESIQRLKDKVGKFFVPLGVGAHLQEWGIEKERIVELNWWEEVAFDDLVFRSTPAQHFSGRGLNDRMKTLWSSWIIESEVEKVFFSGDSGYASHFKEIGEKYGPFDFAMIECGQYNELWPDVHMFPEETAQAGLDLKAKKMMPIHWGAFKLSTHRWTDPVERVSKKAKELNIELITPKIGEPIDLIETQSTFLEWWKD